MKLNSGILAAILAVAFLSITSQASADVYQWIDAKGKVHYTEVQGADNDAGAQLVVPPESKPKQPGQKSTEKASRLPAEPADCTTGKDSFEKDGKVYCCNSKCLKQRFTEGLPVNCLDPRCDQALQKIREQQAK